MKRQEKIELKKTLIPISESMFERDKKELFSNYPFLTMDDDDIEDDPEIMEALMPKEPENPFEGYETIAPDETIDSYWNHIYQAGSPFELLRNAARGYEKHHGIYLSANCEYMIRDSSAHGGMNIVRYHNESQKRYLQKLEYVELNVPAIQVFNQSKRKKA